MGWPMLRGCELQIPLKVQPIRKILSESITYIGIAVNEKNRFHSLSDAKKSPLLEAGWTENDCLKWCKSNGLLSPIYTTIARGGCWFCHNQSVNQLRMLRRNYPEYWALMLRWDTDSPVTFKANGRTVHDYDRRFQLEDDGLITPKERFLWSMLDDDLNYRIGGAEWI